MRPVAIDDCGLRIGDWAKHPIVNLQSSICNRQFLCLFMLLSVLAGPPPVVIGQPTTPAVQRLRGIIDQDQTWSGLILITDDLLIQDATVTITAGTTVEFAYKSPGHHPTLTVGSADRSGGYLKLLGTGEKPVTFRTRPDTNPGRLVINVRSRIVPAEAGASDPLKLTPSEYTPSDVTWQHVRFEDLGYSLTRQSGEREARLAEPAVTFNMIGAAHTLGVVSCTFENTTRLLVRAADGARITITANRFDRPKQRASLEIFGHEGAAPAGAITITRNSLAAGIRLNAATATIANNVLIGPDAAIVIQEDDSSETQITENYIHNTTQEDDGHYCLKCGNPNALIKGNIFRGGSYCVYYGSRRMSGNVFIAASSLSGRLVKKARTHQLVHALPPGATFERNLLLGPAYSLLMPQPHEWLHREEKATNPTIVQHNLFDGFSDSNRAVHLNPLGRTQVPVAVLNNLFLRVPSLVYDEGKTGTALTYADHNAVAPPAPRAFDQIKISGLNRGDPGWGANDVQCSDVASLGLAAPFRRPVPNYDAEIQARKISVGRLREQLFSAYRPMPHSSLVRAGRPHSVAGTDTPPSIGPSEPTEK